MDIQLYGQQTLIPAAPTTYNCVAATGTALEVNHIVRLLVDTTAAAATINLPSISSFGGKLNTVVFVVDSANNAGANNIIVNCGGGDSISSFDTSGTTATIATNKGAIRLEPAGPNTWSIGYY